MNIALDISPLKSGHYLQHRVRGTGFYVHNLRQSFEKYFPNNKYTFFNRGELLPRDIDVTHYPYFEPYFLTLPLFLRNKTIVTIHDLTPLVFPNHFKSGLKGFLKWQIQKFTLKRVNAIITDSLSSKKDIVKYAGIEESKVNVIYLAAGEEFQRIHNSVPTESGQNLRRKYNLPEKFVLYVGDVTWNKNLPRLIAAIKKVNVPLVMVGQALTNIDIDFNNPWNKDFAKVLTLTEKDESIIRLGFVTSTELILLYNVATVFAMPSLYEGFGLPILEAMSCGCPVVTSRQGSIPEIAGEACIFVDAYNIESIASGIKRIFYDESLRKEVSEKGISQSKKFTWNKTANRTMEVYQKIIDQEKFDK